VAIPNRRNKVNHLLMLEHMDYGTESIPTPVNQSHTVVAFGNGIEQNETGWYKTE
jgi:hypothetical protein